MVLGGRQQKRGFSDQNYKPMGVLQERGDTSDVIQVQFKNTNQFVFGCLIWTAERNFSLDNMMAV